MGRRSWELDFNRFWCDVVAFEEALAAERVSDAMDLYGRDLLEGFHLSGAPEFERWLETQRTRLRRQGARAAWTLAERSSESGAAARWARRAARFTPADETAARRLMELLVARGDAIGALREYEEFRTRAREEFGIEPGRETRALAETIRTDAKPRRRGVSRPVRSRPSSSIPVRSSREEEGDRRVGLPGAAREAPRQKPVSARVVGIGLGLVILASMGTGLLLNGESRGLEFGGASRLTDAEGLEIEPAISPSGDRVVYATGETHAMRIAVRRVAGGRPVTLSDGIAGTHRWPVWDPAGERVAFIAYEESGASRLYVVPATGGPPRVLVRADPGDALAGLSWSPDGMHVAFKQGRSLYTLNLDSGESSHLADAWAPHSLAWSPSGD